MANNEGFYTLQVQTLFLLWSYAVINCMEIVLYMTHIIEISDDFWIKFSISFYILWSILGTVASGSGIYGIEKNFPEVLLRNIQYFLVSAALKGIFTVILFISLADPDNFKFHKIIAYASSGPLLLTLIDRFTNNFPPLPIALAHIIVIAFLLCMALIVRYYQKATFKKNTNIEQNDSYADEISMH